MFRFIFRSGISTNRTTGSSISLTYSSNFLIIYSPFVITCKNISFHSVQVFNLFCKCSISLVKNTLFATAKNNITIPKIQPPISFILTPYLFPDIVILIPVYRLAGTQHCQYQYCFHLCFSNFFARFIIWDGFVRS